MSGNNPDFKRAADLLDMSMERTRVNSRGIVSAGYDDRSNTLEIEFPGGAVYQYLRVPEPLYRDLLAAESKGRFVNLYIKPYFESRESDS